jgi:hypothetical protein
MAKTLGAIVNAGLKIMGEPEITSFTSGNILQENLIEECNNGLRKILGRFEPDWSYKRTTLSMQTDVTSGAAKVTNGSATLTSVDSDGDDDDNFSSNVTANRSFFRASADNESYLITAVSTGSTPDTATLENTYRGSTATAGGYRIYTPIYPISTSDFGEIQMAGYGDAGAWTFGLSGVLPNNQLRVVSMQRLYQLAGGDLGRDTTGRPMYLARFGVDSSDNPQYWAWPFPTDDYYIEIWYQIEYSENTTFGTNMFSGDAPILAYDVVESYVKARAYEWDKQLQQAQKWDSEFEIGVATLITRDNLDNKEVAMAVETNRRAYGSRYPVVSQRWFDTKPAQR